MRHEPKLTHLLLLHLRDGGYEAQIEAYPADLILDQKARLIEEGLATGRAIKDGLKLRWVKGLQINAAGHRWLEARESPESASQESSPKMQVRKLAAIMFSDIAGYVAMTQQNEALAVELLEEHRQLLRSIFPNYQGQEIKTIGDAFLVQFESTLAAVECAIQIQQQLGRRNEQASNDKQILVRIGIHIGDVIHRDGDVLGDGVNIAARLYPIAMPGGICVSEDVERQVHNKVEGATLIKVGPTELKHIQEPMGVWRVLLPGEELSSVSGRMKPLDISTSDLTEFDSFLLTRVCQLVLEKEDFRFRLFSKDLWERLKLESTSERDFYDALEILHNRGHISGTVAVRGRGIFFFYVSHNAIDGYLRASFDGYDSLVEQIAFEIVANGARKARDLAERFHRSEVLISHIFAVLENDGRVTLAKPMGGNWWIKSISAELKRSARRA